MNQKLSLHKEVQAIFLANPDSIYTTENLCSILNNRNFKTHKYIITMILTRLHRNGLIHRTPTQLKDGYCYSLRNVAELNRIYHNYLLPYDFDDKEELITKIQYDKFEKLSTTHSLNLNALANFDFVKKYSIEYFQLEETRRFLALMVGFIMCDGCIDKKGRVSFFFRRKDDAQLFVENFKRLFPLEEFRIRVDNNGASYTAQPLKEATIAELLCKLGTPKGKKVFQHFLVPDWIFNGPDDLRRVFLSTVIGNEGSAPSHNRWRIQFVLSKSKEHVSILLDFLNQIRAMLYHFGVTTSHIQLRKQPGRQFHGRFYIKGKENLHKFYKQFSFLYASEKQEVLMDLILKDKNPLGAMRNDRSEHQLSLGHDERM